MRVLIACECSGIVRDAFAARGHDAWSCDLLPSERPGNHLQTDVQNVLRGQPLNSPALRRLRGRDHDPWDLIIAHPPCQYLCNSGVRWLYTSRIGEGDRDELKFRDGVRWARMREAARFFKVMLDAPALRVAVENPIMHKYAREAAQIPRATQNVQPWQFWTGQGKGEVKATCLWLKGLPKLVPTTPNETGRIARVWRMGPSPTRSADRARTYPGIAAAMAEQWGSL